MGIVLITVTVDADKKNFDKIVKVLEKDFYITQANWQRLTLTPKHAGTKADIWFDLEGCPRV